MKISIALFIISCLIACNHPVKKPANVNSVIHPINQQTLELKPTWVLNPERVGYISVVGFAPKQQQGGKQAQYKVAMLKAQQELAQIVRVRVRNHISQTIQESNGNSTSNENVTTSLNTNVSLRLGNANVSAQWIDPSDGGLYLLLEIPN